MFFFFFFADSFTIKVIWLHTGTPSRVTISAAPVDTGLLCIPGDKEISGGFCAHFANLRSTANAITIGNNGYDIQTIEHLMAAFYAYDINNAYIRVYGSEIPILDGSSQKYIQAFEEVGVAVQHALQKIVYIPYPMWIESNGSYLIVLPNEQFKITYTIDFNSKSEAIGTQTAHYTITKDTFRSSIASARTFGFVEDLERMQQNNLALGGSLDNALAYTKDGLINDYLRYENECVRHKMLDLIGDLSLIGYKMMGHFIAYKSGHSLDLAFVRKIYRIMSRISPRLLSRDIIRRKEIRFNRFIQRIQDS